ncbi:TonB-dependent receptor [Hephaestia sp. GCM10023244]|uniref:TonB-dependent receptor n=1 Tax=unclassified Hephaestia TaxID=2631281 RepID=UPI0020777E9C|nr:TonB-dependent siderophore receptor [Hephaestia sp. MAHUQ-44]MCM8729354.1 TonB-dependent receptor [Hephaestia sp. MAHUQ-44]
MRLAIRLLTFSAIAAPVAMPAAVAAQDAPPEEIVVTAQQAQKQVVSDGVIGVLGNKTALETPFNVTTYTAQLVLDQQSETIGDVLKNEPSVRTTYGFGNQSEQFVIRGFALYGDDVAIDGLFGVTPRQLVSPELYESVQVLNGANAFLFGAAPSGSGIGGSINLVPKRAEKTLLRATGSFSADSIFGGNVDLGTRFGAGDAFGIRVNGVYRKGETAIDREQREVRVAGASFDFRKGPGRFFLDVGYEDQRAYAGRPIVQLGASAAVPAAPRANANYAQDWSFTELRDIYALARAEIDLAPEVMLYLAAGLRDGREDGEYSTLTITNGATGAATASRMFVPREDNNESGQAGIRGKFRTGGISHEINAGVSVNFTENRNSFAFGDFPAAVRAPCGAGATAFCTNLYTPVQVAKPADSTIPGFVSGSFTKVPRVSTGAFASVFASDTIGIADDRLLVTLGARRQNIQVDAYNRTTRARTAHYDESATTPVIGIIARPTEHLSFYANRVEGLAQGPTAPTNANTLNAGEVFAPFKSTQYEVGAKLAVRGLTATAAIFQTTQPSSFNAPTPTTANPNAVTFVVDGEQRNRGIELSLNGEPSRFVRFIGGLTINDAKLTRTLNGTNDGNQAVGVPDYQVNFGTEIVPPFLRNATITGRIVHTAEQQVDVVNLRQIPAWTRFDLGLRYILVTDTRPITLRLSADNIANKGYWASSFGGYLLQGAPRTVKASVTVEF